jgi:hypothetical protein
MRRTRRELLLSAGAGAAAALAVPAAAEAATSSSAASSLVSPQLDLTVPERLVRLLQIELLLLFCYRHVLASSILSPRARRTLTPFAGHEVQHIAALERLLRARGGRVPRGPANAHAANRDLAKRKIGGRLGQLKGDLDAVRLLQTTEQVTIGAYDTALATLADSESDLTELCCQIMANEAQHDAMLALLLPPGKIPSAVPYGLVQGLQ